jgi:dihydroorotate dehydrogenase electron transfer subunit
MSHETLPIVARLQIPETGPSRVVSNRQVGPGWFLLRLEEPQIARASRPGQFVQVLCAAPGGVDPLLRRPFSVYDSNPRDGTYDLLYTVSGRGTRWMSLLPESGRPRPLRGVPRGEGLEVDVIGPFGNRFTPPRKEDLVVLAGGGVGVAPLYFFARELCARAEGPPRTVLCMGARSATQIQGLEDFRKLPIHCEVSTDDGSAGFRGRVTELLAALLDGDLRESLPRLRLYGCGPTGMNEALRRLAVERQVACEICLEARMACGFGICFACVVPIRKELAGPLYNRRICLEGCVFDAHLLGEGLGTIPLGGVIPEGPICPAMGKS